MATAPHPPASADLPAPEDPSVVGVVPRAPFELDRALDQLRGRKSLLVYMHDNPDPDALAAALGLKRLFEHELGMNVTLGLGGIVGRAQNRAMVDILGIPLMPIEDLDVGAYEALAIVDSQPGTGNNSLPQDRGVDVVVDHHPARGESARATWCDIRPELGATSTIVLQYLRERGVAIDQRLATALFFALRTETRDLGRESTEAERTAYLYLVALVDHDLLFRISHPKVPREHFIALDRALRSAQVWGDLVAVNLGELSYPDLVAEVADLLLSYEGARMVLCCGRYNKRAFLSLRTEATQRRAGSLMRQLIGAEGAAGGHGTMAGGRLFRPMGSDGELQTSFDDLVRRFLQLTGRTAVTATPLVDR